MAATTQSPPPRLASPRGRPRRRPAPAAPGEPWLADHPWRRDGAADLSPDEARRALLAGGILTLAASLLAAALLPETGGEAVAVPVLVLGALLLVGLWLLSRGVRTVLRRGRHGVSELRFARFPYLLGEPLDATLVRQGATAALDGVMARLTCYQERLDEGTGAPGEPQGDDRYVRVARWSETRPVPGVTGARAPLRFDLPRPGAEVVGTALSTDPPSYWELEVWARPAEGPAYHAAFLVPVYQRPEPARTTGA